MHFLTPVLIAMAASVLSTGQPPNDDCIDAIPIDFGYTPYTTIGATDDAPPLPNACDEGFGLGFGAEIWFNYDSSFTGTLIVSTCNQADYDSRLAAYTGGCADLTLVACNDDAPCAGFTSYMEVPVVAGEVYLIAVGGFNSEEGSGTVTLSKSFIPFVGACCLNAECFITTGEDCLAQGGFYIGDGTECTASGSDGDGVLYACHSNDDCIDAFPIDVGDTPYTTIGATDDAPPLPRACDEGFGLGFGAEIWFNYDSSFTGTLIVSTCSQADYDSRLAAYTGGCADLTLVACNDDAPCAGFTSYMEVPVVGGEVYLIAVGGWESTEGSGTVTLTKSFLKGHQKISHIYGNFTGMLDDEDRFGVGVAALGDLDGDGVADMAVGAHMDDDGGTNRGAVWILFLNPDGTVKAHQKISSTEGSFEGPDGDGRFGSSLAAIGDLDGDGVQDLAVGAYRDDDGGLLRGAVWILFLNPDGTVKTEQKISDLAGGFNGGLDDLDRFGHSVAALGDLDGDGLSELAVGAYFDDDGGTNRGAVWVLFLGGQPPPPKCPADFDNSGDVGVKDLLFLLGAWGPCPPKGDCLPDFDNSGDVGVKDLLFLLGAWGPCS